MYLDPFIIPINSLVSGKMSPHHTAEGSSELWRLASVVGLLVSLIFSSCKTSNKPQLSIILIIAFAALLAGSNDKAKVLTLPPLLWLLVLLLFVAVSSISICFFANILISSKIINFVHNLFVESRIFVLFVLFGDSLIFCKLSI